MYHYYLFCHLHLDISATPYQCINYSLLLEEAVARRCSANKVLLKILQNSQEKTCRKLFFNKVAGLGTSTLSSHTFKRLSYQKLLCNSFICSYQLSSPVKRKEKIYIRKCNNISKILRKKIPRNKVLIKVMSN